MTVGLLLRRLNQLPHLEGTARALAKSGHRTLLLLAPQGEGKPWLRPEEARIPERWRGWVEFCPLDKSPDLDALLVPSALGVSPDYGLPRARVYAALQTTVSDLLSLRLGQWNVVYTWSPSWAGWWAEAHHDFPSVALSEPRFVPVGMPLAESLTWIDPEEVRKAYDLGPGPAVLYLPFPFGAHAQGWRLRWGYRLSPWGDRATVRAVRRYCDRVGAQLVVSLRRKVDNPGYVSRAADVVVEGEPAEPTVLRLLTCARLLVHHMSSGVAEAAICGVQALNVLPGGWTAYADRGRDFTPRPNCAAQTFYEWIGVCQTFSPSVMVDWLDQIEGMPPLTTGFRDHPDGRAAYLARYLGGEPFRAGERIVEDLERRVG